MLSLQGVQGHKLVSEEAELFFATFFYHSLLSSVAWSMDCVLIIFIT